MNILVQLLLLVQYVDSCQQKVIHTWQTLGHDGKTHPSSNLWHVSNIQANGEVNTQAWVIFTAMMSHYEGFLLPHMCNLDRIQRKIAM